MLRPAGAGVGGWTSSSATAARSVLSGAATAVPKTGDGVVEMIRQVKIAKDTATKARTQASPSRRSW